jgi:hypothetical protein
MGVVKRPQLPVDARNAKYFSRCASSALRARGTGAASAACWPSSSCAAARSPSPGGRAPRNPRNCRCRPARTGPLEPPQLLVAACYPASCLLLAAVSGFALARSANPGGRPPGTPRCAHCSHRLLSASQVLGAIPREGPGPRRRNRGGQRPSLADGHPAGTRDVHHDFIRRIRGPDGELVGSVYQQECLSGCLCGLTGGFG